VDRNLVLVSGAMLLLALGENLWKKFLPAYLQALGAPIRAVGLFGSAQDLIDGLYQYPGGWLGDRLGRRNALLLFAGAALAGYCVYAITSSWTWTLLALALSAAWTSMASPTLFAVVGDALPKTRRAIGFTLQSILRRLPIAVAPIAGGLLIARMGILPGMQMLFAVTIVLGVATLLVVRHVNVPRIEGKATNIRGVWSACPRPLRFLLLSDVFIRTCEGMVDVFLVIYATRVIGLSLAQFGVLISIQTVTAIAVYLPAARYADRLGRKPFVIATFLAFSLFPLAVVWSTTFLGAAFAFVIGGLREVGEPSRKALIVDLAEPALRARTVGLYYLIRSVAVAPAAVVGGVLFERAAGLPFLVAAAIGVVGTGVFAGTVRE
jgi:MFS family permease